MMDTQVAEKGVAGFVAGLRRLGITSVIESGVVRFSVEIVGGARCGQVIASGVGVDELANWPALPPHWVHLPGDIAFRHTNAQASSVAGWLKHSRDIKNWNNASDPVQAWGAHVRAILEEAL